MGVTLLDVARATSCRWQERRPGVTSSDVVAMGATILEVERETSRTWQERREESEICRNCDGFVGI
jgi:hypothetical protein